MKPTAEQLAKLPAWAKSHIEEITRSNELAIRSLNEYCDNSTPSPFYISDAVCTNEKQCPSFKKHFVQAHTMTVEFDGVRLDISANHYNGRKGIELQWSSYERGGSEIAMIPDSFQKVRLITKEMMRV